MCGKATPEPGGVSGAGGAEGRIWRAFVSRHKQKISQGWWAPLDAEAQVQHNANERVPLWPRFAATDSRAQSQRQVVRGRQTDTNCREDLRPRPGGFYSRKGHPRSQADTQRGWSFPLGIKRSSTVSRCSRL